MYHQPIDKKELINRIALYVAMTLSIGVIVTFIVLFILGYRIDTNDGRIEQYSMLQFNSNPSGATITIDDGSQKLQTPSKVTIPAGKHTISINKTGYETWSKTIDSKSGSLIWLNYALLVPKILSVEPVLAYNSVFESLATNDGRRIIVSEKPELPIFNLSDISSGVVQSTKLTIPSAVYSEANVAGAVHSFHLDKWDEGGRYIIVRHNYGEKNEWLVVDTQDVNLTKNITKLFNFSISSIEFSGTSGNSFYVLGGEDIRKVDLLAGTISRPLVSRVASFSSYDSNVISYVGKGSELNQIVVGLYRDGDDNPYVVKTIADGDVGLINSSVSKYYGQYYLAISNDKSVEVLSGAYPVSINDVSNMKHFTSFISDRSVKNLFFNPSGQHLIAQSNEYFSSYNLEYQILSSSTIKGEAATTSLGWLNDNYLWSDRGGDLSIFEFDGLNTHVINKVSAGQAVVITSNGRYLYSIDKTLTGYQLQRVRMILP